MEALGAVAVVAVACLVGLRWLLAFKAREADRERLHAMDCMRLGAESAGAKDVAELSKRLTQLEAWRDTQALRSLRQG